MPNRPLLWPAADAPKRNAPIPVRSGQNLEEINALPSRLGQRYGIVENPFGVSPDPRYLYENNSHREALSSLVVGVECGVGFQALIAPPGMGKTSLLFRVLETFEDAACTAFLFQFQGGPRELLCNLLSDWGIDSPEGDLIHMQDQINQRMLLEWRAGRRTIIIIDEAQNLDDRVLETLRLLSNFERPSEKLLHIVLAGQPQLADRLSHPEFAHLCQRISIVTGLKPLRREETGDYVEHRMKTAGYSGTQLFTPPALHLVWEHSRGIPRGINRICFNSLLLGAELDQKQIDRAVVHQAVASLDLRQFFDGGPDPPPAAKFGLVHRETLESVAASSINQSESELQHIGEKLRLTAGAEGVAIALAEGEELVCQATAGNMVPKVGSHIDIHSGLTGQCVRTADAVVCNDAETDCSVDADACKGLGVRSVLAFPMKRHGALVGVLELLSAHANAFRQEHVQILAKAADEILRIIDDRTRGWASQQQYEGESGQEQRTNNTAQCGRTTAAELIGPQDETEPIGFEQVASFGQRHMWWRSWKRTAFVGGLFVAVFLAYQLRLIYFTRVQGNQAASSIKVGDNRHKVVTTEQPAQTPQQASGTQQSSRTSFSQPHSTLSATADSKVQSINGFVPGNDLDRARSAAETGNATAEYQMGLRYAAGAGVPRDESASAEWFKKAANQGHVEAQRALSDLYLNGRGVPRDYVRAYTWASIALSRDNNNHHNKELKSMASLMTPTQISDANTRIAVWSKQRGTVQP